MRYLKTNTATIVTVGPFYDKTDGVTIETSLTITNERITFVVDANDGSAPTLVLDNVTGATSGTSNDLNYITDNDAGLMQLELAAANVNYLGRAMLTITDAANHCPVFHEFMILPAMVFDSLIAGTDVMQADMTQILGTAVSTPATAGLLDVNAIQLSGDATAANNAESFFDGTGYAGTNNVIPTVTTVGTTTNLTNLPAAAALEATLTAMKGATFAGATDSLEAIRDRGDAAWGTATGFATPTNITAGTITTVTNLTNAPTAGDLTATMKASVTTAATAATPTAAAVTGAVGSVTAPVTAGTVSDKTGYALSSAGVQAIWDALTSALTTAGSVGKRIADYLDVAVSSRGTSTYAGGDTSGTTTLLSRIVGTLATGTHSPQSGDSYARLGAPAGASVSADVAAVKAQTAAIETDTQDLQTQVGTDGAGLTAIGDTRLANLDAAVSSRLATAGYTAPLDAAGTRTAVGLATANLDTQLAALPTDADVQTAATAALNAYDPPTKAELDSGLAGLNDPTAAAVADAVWDEAIAGHAGAGSTGEALAAAGSAGDPWATALPGAYGSGTAGKIIGDNINATVSSRASQTSVDDLPTNAELASALASADDATLAAIGALNNLSSAQAQTAATAALNAYDPPTKAELDSAVAPLATASALSTVAGYVDTEVAAIKAVTDKVDTALEADGATGYQFTALALENAPTGGSAPSAADIRAEIDSNSTQLAAIVADTNELQTNQGNWLTATGFATPTNITAGTITTVTNLTNAPTSGDLTATMKASVTAAVPTAAQVVAAIDADPPAVNVTLWSGDAAPAMTGDAYARLGAPTGASVSADIAAVKTSADGLAAVAPDNKPNVNAGGQIDANLQSWRGVAPLALSSAKVRTYPDGTLLRYELGLAAANLDTQLGTVAKTGADGDTLETLSDQLDGFTGIDGQDVADALLLAPSGVAAAGSAMDYLAEIKTKTDNLPADPADQSSVEAAITAATSPLATQSSVDDLPTNAELANAVAAIPADVDAELSGTHGAGSWEGGAGGVGTVPFQYLVKDTLDNPIANVRVVVTTDLAGLNIYDERYTDAFGIATFHLIPGTWYFWPNMAGYAYDEGTLPDVEVVE